ncbi:hypothetical protein [Flavobacterium phage FL-1]|nr:hypothetical protein [Flavobacterium phage FL-1]
MDIQEILIRLKGLKKYDASADYFREVHHEEYHDGFWIGKDEIDKLIQDIENNEHL